MYGKAISTNSLSGFLRYLEQQEILSEHDIQHVTELLASTSELFDQIISKLGLMSEKTLTIALSKYAKLPLLDDETGLIPAGSTLNRAFLEKHRILPLRCNSSQEFAALIDPFDRQAIEGLQFALDAKIPLYLMTHSQWERLSEQLFSETEDAVEGFTADIAEDAARLADLASSEPVIRLVNRLIAKASERNASDIHIEAAAREASVRFRVDGVLEDIDTLSVAQGLSVISRIKILADLDIAERRRPQDGRFSFPLAGRAIDLRLSTVPTDHGESAVLRLLDHGNVALDYESLGYTEETVAIIRRLLEKPHGILLVTGPTGSGKTTTLYTFLQELATGTRKILTIEDPIEYRLSGISQSQVNPKIDVTFASALRSFLRHDPDVMMVGEIRDLETATIAIQAALTGHLVLSTLHTNDAVSAITRLRDLGVEDYLIASTMNGVLGQRLVRRLCKEEECGDVRPVCHGTSYQGRLAIVEALEITPALSEAIRQGASEQELLTLADGFQSMREDGLAKVTAGLTTNTELNRALGSTLGSTLEGSHG